MTGLASLAAVCVARLAERSPAVLRLLQSDFTGRWRVINELRPNHLPENVLANVNGIRMFVSFVDSVQRDAFFGHYEPDSTRLLISLVRPGDVIIDVGANVGVITLQLARALRGRGRVHAFEPSPEVNRQLKRNCSLNPELQQLISVHDVALGEVPGVMPFYAPVEEGGAGWGSLARFDDIESNQVSVNVETLDRMMEALGRPQIRVVKMDIEGFEVEALRGAKDTLAAQRIDYFVIEFNGGRLLERHVSWADFIAPLQDAGYEPRFDLLDDETMREFRLGRLPAHEVMTNVCFARSGVR